MERVKNIIKISVSLLSLALAPVFILYPAFNIEKLQSFDIIYLLSGGITFLLIGVFTYREHYKKKLVL